MMWAVVGMLPRLFVFLYVTFIQLELFQPFITLGHFRVYVSILLALGALYALNGEIAFLSKF